MESRSVVKDVESRHWFRHFLFLQTIQFICILCMRMYECICVCIVSDLLIVGNDYLLLFV